MDCGTVEGCVMLSDCAVSSIERGRLADTCAAQPHSSKHHQHLCYSLTQIVTFYPSLRFSCCLRCLCTRSPSCAQTGPAPLVRASGTSQQTGRLRTLACRAKS
jgi:hypothetical protein